MSEIITNYVAPAPENKYAKVVAELAENPGSAYAIIARTTAPEGERGSIVGEKAAFQRAARDAGYTARETERDVRDDGTTRVVVILKDKVTRKPKKDADAPVNDEKPAKAAK